MEKKLIEYVLEMAETSIHFVSSSMGINYLLLYHQTYTNLFMEKLDVFNSFREH